MGTLREDHRSIIRMVLESSTRRIFFLVIQHVSLIEVAGVGRWKKALEVVDAEGAEPFVLRLGLDAFGDRPRAESLRQASDRVGRSLLGTDRSRFPARSSGRAK
jgi:hypothetical protein